MTANGDVSPCPAVSHLSKLCRAVALGRILPRRVVVVHAIGPSHAAVVGSGVSGLGPGVWQQHHPLPGGWWRAMGARRRLQCAQGLVLGPAYRGRCDTQGGHNVWDGHPGHHPQQDHLAVGARQRGNQREEPGAVPGVDTQLAVLAGICGSSRLRLDRREDRRWRHRCLPDKGSATAKIGHCGHPRTPLRVLATGRLNPVGPLPTGSSSRPTHDWPATPSETLVASLVTSGDTRATRDLRRRDSPGMHATPPDGRCSKRVAEL
jgi:hypothetical protein